MVISDVHSNLPALRAVLDHARNDPKGVVYDRKFCLGDVVGYGPFPKECVEIIRSEGFETVLGNHDRAVLAGDYEGFKPVARLAAMHNRSVLKRSPENRSYLEGLRPSPVFDPKGRFGLVHGSFCPAEDWISYKRKGFVADSGFEDIYILDENDLKDALMSMRTQVEGQIVQVPIGFVGHSHLPLSAKGEIEYIGGEPIQVNDLKLTWLDELDYNAFGKKSIQINPPTNTNGFVTQRIINFGSVGQPRHGSPRACYGIFFIHDDGTVYVEYRSVEYSVSDTQEKMRKENERLGREIFKQRLVDRLAVGQ